VSFDRISARSRLTDIAVVASSITGITACLTRASRLTVLEFPVLFDSDMEVAVVL